MFEWVCLGLLLVLYFVLVYLLNYGGHGFVVYSSVPGGWFPNVSGVIH